MRQGIVAWALPQFLICSSASDPIRSALGKRSSSVRLANDDPLTRDLGFGMDYDSWTLALCEGCSLTHLRLLTTDRNFLTKTKQKRRISAKCEGE